MGFSSFILISKFECFKRHKFIRAFRRSYILLKKWLLLGYLKHLWWIQFIFQLTFFDFSSMCVRSDKTGIAQKINFVLRYMYLKIKWSEMSVVGRNIRPDTTHATFSIARHSLTKIEKLFTKFWKSMWSHLTLHKTHVMRLPSTA